MTRHATGALTLGLALTFALAACVPAAVVPVAESGSPTPGDTTASPSLGPSPTPAPTTAPVGDFGFTYFHDAQLGATFAQMSAQLGYPVAGLAECPHYGAVDPGSPDITYAFTDAQNPSAGVSFFYSQAQDGVTAYPKTAEGVGLGSTPAQVQAAYPGAVLDSMKDPGAGPIQRLTVDDPATDSKYVFGASEGSATINLVQWGTKAGNQWSHLCGGL